MEARASETNAATNLDDTPRLCNICTYHTELPQLANMPDMLFNENCLRLEHFTGVGIEFNAFNALKRVEATKDPLQVAIAGGWQSARADFPFANKVVKPFDWTFTTDYRGTVLERCDKVRGGAKRTVDTKEGHSQEGTGHTAAPAMQQTQPKRLELCLSVEETSERIDVNKLKVREEILFYDDVPLYEDELADHGTASYSVKVRVMPRCLFILARFYLRIDDVLARINDTRVYHEFNKKYLLREYTNREVRLSSLPQPLPISTLTNPNELAPHLPIVTSVYERLTLPRPR